MYGNSIFAGTFLNGFFVSNDNGISWTQRNENFPTGRIPTAIIVLNNYIFVATDGSGVYRRPISELVGIKPITSEIPETFSLSQNYPNPFNPTTKIRFDVKTPLSGMGGTWISLKIYDILSREVATLVNEHLKPGSYEVEWNGTNYSSGVYWYRLSWGDLSTNPGQANTVTKKMVLLK